MDKSLLVKYFNGEHCTEEELRLLEAWLHSASQTEAFFYDQWMQAEGKVEQGTGERLWAGISAATSAKPLALAPVRQLWLWRRAAIAVAVAGVLLAAGLVYRNPHNQAVATVWKTIENSSKDVKYVRLTDGSEVWLNAHSVLSYDEAYLHNGRRETKLSGEAYFEVVKDAKRPFIVHTGRLKTTVLGTAFDIRAWQSLKQVQVALVHGKVNVTIDSSEKQAVLLPGTILSYDLSMDELVLQEKGVREDRVSWVKGKIVLDNTPLPDLMRQLEQIYKVSIVIPAGLPDSIRLSGQFRRDPIGNVLNNVLFPMGLTYSYEGGQYFIHSSKIK